MTVILTSSSSSSSLYFGPLDFQEAFDSTFLHPIPLWVTASPAIGTSGDSFLLPVPLNNFLDSCRFLLVVPIFPLDYVSTFARIEPASLQATIFVLVKKVTMSSPDLISGAWVTLHANEVFAVYSNLIPLLLFKVSILGLNLGSQYVDPLSLSSSKTLSILLTHLVCLLNMLPW